MISDRRGTRPIDKQPPIMVTPMVTRAKLEEGRPSKALGPSKKLSTVININAINTMYLL